MSFLKAGTERTEDFAVTVTSIEVLRGSPKCGQERDPSEAFNDLYADLGISDKGCLPVQAAGRTGEGRGPRSPWGHSELVDRGPPQIYSPGGLGKQVE